ncbi:hypothetical protein C3E78_14455 [Aeromicrobium chenweiae]|uniref:Uncharacterized protein n=1 Tax=Aeromicrobium chenweiae TaxID=2079793 RepID=A0A2S0WPP1_9ACTN|nr:hypothetical protein C3E78_14455 [Aeromicrobium chenweiae]
MAFGVFFIGVGVVEARGDGVVAVAVSLGAVANGVTSSSPPRRHTPTATTAAIATAATTTSRGLRRDEAD